MITGELKSQVDKIWEAFWTGGISNPLTVIEQFTFLPFLRRIDERQLLENGSDSTFLLRELNSIIHDYFPPTSVQPLYEK